MESERSRSRWSRIRCQKAGLEGQERDCIKDLPPPHPTPEADCLKLEPLSEQLTLLPPSPTPPYDAWPLLCGGGCQLSRDQDGLSFFLH